jgi:hypothetical protein
MPEFATGVNVNVCWLHAGQVALVNEDINDNVVLTIELITSTAALSLAFFILRPPTHPAHLGNTNGNAIGDRVYLRR